MKEVDSECVILNKIRMKALYTAVATTTGGRSGKVKSSDGLIDFDLRPPKEMGGPDGSYTNPEQLFAAGFSACFGSAISHAAMERKIRTRPAVTAKVSKGKHREQGGWRFSACGGDGGEVRQGH